NQVAHFRNIVQRHLFRRQQSRRHHRQRRILRPADRHRPPQRLPAPNPKFVHSLSRLLFPRRGEACCAPSGNHSRSSHSPSASRKSPPASFNLFFASATPIRTFNITNATRKSCPAALRACSAADTLFPLA